MTLCEGCGASYDSSFHFCPYCGRGNPEVAAKIQIEVSRKDQWEICDVLDYTYYVKNFGAAKDFRKVEEGYLHAAAVGPLGKYTAGVSPIYSVDTRRNVRKRTTETTFSGFQPAHTILVNQLVRDGWEPGEARGGAWWQLRFRRRLGIECPRPFVAWLVDRRCGLRACHFSVLGPPEGNEESPTRGPKSERAPLPILTSSAAKKAAQLPVFDAFLRKLQSQGYELTPSSTNELAKDCYKDRIYDTYFTDLIWYSRILLKRM